MRGRMVAEMAALALVLAACGGAPSDQAAPAAAPTTRSAVGTATTTGTAAQRPICGWTAKPPATWKHVIWIWMENQDYQQVVGNPDAPYENRTLIAGCGLATNYHNITHPSLPNYLAATSGTRLDISDCGPDACPTTSESLFSQLRAAGKEWRAYQESMPANCAHQDSGAYAARHNPPVYYTRIAADCARWDVPMGDDSGNLARDLRGDRLPAFAFITPNLCNDTHDCPVRTGDQWLATWVPRILESPAYQAGTTVVLLTWDEGEGGGNNDCATDTRTPGCHVPAIVISPATQAGTRSGALFNHYSLLETTELLLGLRPALGHAADPATRDMRRAFKL
jgi:phosphatidylinositol-3-phosphatase